MTGAMDGYFEGTYRRIPEQNLAGASRNSGVSQLINKAQCERKKREEARLIQEKALMIQSVYRGYVCRKYWKQIYSKEVELKMNEVLHDTSSISIKNLHYLLQRMVLIYPKTKKFRTKQLTSNDLQNLLFMVKLLQNSKTQVIEAMSIDKFWIWRIVYFLTICLQLLDSLPPGNEDNALNILQVFSSLVDAELYSQVLANKSIQIYTLMWGEMLKHDLLKYLLSTLNFKKVFKSHTFDEILNFINYILKNIFHLINSTNDINFRNSALEIIVSSLMKPPLNNAIVSSILPNLRSMEEFPIADLARICLSGGKENVTPECLFRFLYLDKDQNAIPMGKQKNYFELLSLLLFQLYYLCQSEESRNEDPDSEPSDNANFSPAQELMLQNSLKLLNTNARTEMWIRYLDVITENNDNESLIVFCKCLYLLWISEQSPIYTHRIIKSVAFHSSFLKFLWQCIVSEKRINLLSNPVQSIYIWNMLAHGVIISPLEADRIVPALTMFCFILKHHLAILNDDFLYENGPNSLPDFVQFRLPDIIEIASILKDVAVGVISLAYPTFSFEKDERVELTSPSDNVSFNLVAWRSLLEQVISLLRLIYIRDSRRQFTKDGFWITVSVLDIKKPNNLIKPLENLVPFASLSGPERSFGVYEDRYFATLRCLPFAIDFIKRFMLLQHFISELKNEHQNPSLHFLHSVYKLVQIRRDYIYEDALDKLSADEVPECRIHIKINWISTLGIEEPGIDGGGLFREFILELLKTAFDPNRGFFIMNKDNELYPNPKIEWIQKDYVRHYSFIGRMLGKAIYENVLVEIPLAEFFLAKLLGDKYDLHLNGLASLDPDMYRNLMSLMTYNGDFSELGLDFTLSLDYFGSNKIIELKTNGANIPVNKDNVLEYIHLVARYKIHVQISKQTEAFLEGLTSVIPQQWIAMFNTKELQLIISGNETPIDIKDMRESVVYAGGYTDKHPTIEIFWRVLSNFESIQRSQLLKFVTSCSRPPLLGFKELHPPFCIQFVENENMLPTASTCMNILKLPNFQDEETMRQKLLYAISSGSGFEMI